MNRVEEMMKTQEVKDLAVCLDGLSLLLRKAASDPGWHTDVYTVQDAQAFKNRVIEIRNQIQADLLDSEQSSEVA